MFNIYILFQCVTTDVHFMFVRPYPNHLSNTAFGGIFTKKGKETNQIVKLKNRLHEIYKNDHKFVSTFSKKPYCVSYQCYILCILIVWHQHRLIEVCFVQDKMNMNFNIDFIMNKDLGTVVTHNLRKKNCTYSHVLGLRKTYTYALKKK